MSYGQFLLEWYNAPFVALGAFGLARGLLRSRRSARGFPWALSGFLAGIAGLTVNGAVHDLGLGSPGPRFPVVLPAALGFGALGAFAYARLRDRMFPPVTGVTFNRRDLAGSVAQIVATADAEPGRGRARVRDEDGTVNVVRVHTAGPRLGFGRRVTLGTYEEERDSYPVESV